MEGPLKIPEAPCLPSGYQQLLLVYTDCDLSGDTGWNPAWGSDIFEDQMGWLSRTLFTQRMEPPRELVLSEDDTATGDEWVERSP